MPYLVKGNAQQIFNAFGQNWAIVKGKDDIKTIQLDFTRCDFLGTTEQASKHYNIWSQEALGSYYLQGNMSAGNLLYLLGPEPLKKENEDPETYHKHFIRQHFAYLDDQDKTSGLMVMYRNDDPKKWMLGIVKNAHAAPKDRELIFLSSLNLAPLIQDPNAGITVETVSSLDNTLVPFIASKLHSQLLHHVFTPDNEEINVRFARVDLLTRTLHIDNSFRVSLNDPIPFHELNLCSLFVDNPALDLMIKYKIIDELSLSTTLLKELLSTSSPLAKALLSIKLTNDEKTNKNLIKMAFVFFEQGLLEENLSLLQDLVFMKTFIGFMWDKTQIQLIPFLRQKNYDIALMRLILSEPAYFKAIYSLFTLEPALTQDVPSFFKDPQKIEELKYIHLLPNEECQLLCLLFWVKANLSEDGYQQIVDATKQYPLLASTLIALDQSKRANILELEQMALTPEQHLPKSIAYHFAKELKNYPKLASNLRQLNTSNELEEASAALIMLKKSKCVNVSFYHKVLETDKKGQLLRLFLPSFAKLDNEVDNRFLLDIVYAGIEHGIQTQGKAVLAIKEPQKLDLAKKIHERFKCVTQMQNLGFDNGMIALAASEHTEEAQRFRRIILRVEAQCKIVYERLSSSVSYRETLIRWQKEEENYRKSLYRIAYQGITNPHTDFKPQLEQVEKKILDIVDPKVDSILYEALIFIANALIFTLSLSLANNWKFKDTGNYWFFNQTRSGEELRALNKEVLRV